MKIAIFSFFSGCGLLDLGFEDAGFEVVFVNEYAPRFLAAYQHNRPQTEPLFGYHSSSITDFLGDKKEQLKNYLDVARQHFDYVGFIGGPPCPDFSVAGKNAGGNGKNGQLSGVYADLLAEFQPDFFLFENVKGLVTTPKHRQYFEQLLGKLQPHFWLTWEVVNALAYGVPQNRERVIILGFRKKTAVNWDAQRRYDTKAVKKLPWPKVSPFGVPRGELPPPAGVPLELTIEYWFEHNQTCRHPNAGEMAGKMRPNTTLYHTLAEGEAGGRQSMVRLHRWKYSRTAAAGNLNIFYHPYLPRHLNLAEYLAIQSAPASFSIPVNSTLTEKYKMVGNAVPYLMAMGLANTIKDSLTWQARFNE